MKFKFIQKKLSSFKKPVKILLYVFLIFIILSILFFVSYKQLAFKKSLQKISNKLEKRGYSFIWNNGRFVGFNKITFGNITVTSEYDSTIFQIDSVECRLSLFRALSGKLKLKSFSCRKMVLFYNLNKDSTIHYSSVRQLPEKKNMNYPAMLNRFVRGILPAIPHYLNITEADVFFNYRGHSTMLMFNDIRIKGKLLNGFMSSVSENDTCYISINGLINKKTLTSELKAYHAYNNKGRIVIPGENPVGVNFDTLKLLAHLPYNSARKIGIHGLLVSQGMVIEGKRLSANPIIIKEFNADFSLLIKPMSVELDSSSVFSFNGISIHPYFMVRKNPQLTVHFKICPQVWDATTFFNSLPEGMFTSLSGFKASGGLRFFLDLSIDMSQIDSLIFNAGLTSEDFRIVGYGADDYRMLNSEFIYSFYEKGALMASFPVGPSNHYFVPLDQISPLLKISVLTSEDGSFFYHKGFNQKAIRESLITNIQRGKFVRGGSTISMQLVKNVFLTRNKTIGRKLEELLIVWIIEQNRLVSKDRMFEIYLNIIEWGPGVYGIGQASEYYFGKKPSELNLQESIFLAGIIPFPKRFKSVFESNGFLKNYFAAYMERMKTIMVSRSYIEDGDTIGTGSQVFLSGPASQAFIDTGEIKADTLMPEEIMDIPLK